MKAVFVLSTGRTGTKFIADYFAGSDNSILSVHEPRFSRHFRMLSNKFLRDRASASALLKAFRLSRKKLFSASFPYSHYLESNNFLFGYAPLFQELFDDYLIVHVVRDPRNYIRSHINHGVFKGNKLLAKKFVPYWFMDVKRFYDFDHEPDAFEVLAARWKVVNRYIEEKSPSSEYLMVKFEDIFQSDAMRMICDAAKLKYDHACFENMLNTRINKGRLDLAGKWQEWPEEHCKKVQAICGNEMRRFGYGDETEWKKKLGVKIG